MQKNHQKTIFEIIKHKLNGQDSLGNAVGEVLSISQDAVYRRYRGETLLTIYELEKLSKHYNISLDALFKVDDHKVIFDFQPLRKFDFSMDAYLELIAQGLRTLKSHGDVTLKISVNNTHFFQLLNFPLLVRFKLFFWAKTYLQVKEYENKLFYHEKIAEASFATGKEILQMYNSVTSAELFDPELFRGFSREIQYYFNAHLFEDRGYAVFLMEQLIELIRHIKVQLSHGKKFIFGTHPPAQGNEIVGYLSDTINGISSTYYKTPLIEGLSIAHNIMNPITTTDQHYVQDSLIVLERRFANSSMISGVNEKERNRYFHQIKRMLTDQKQQMESELGM